MLRNNNRKFMKTLSNNCLKANKKRNRIAVLAIVLTAVLFMALTTVFEGVQVSTKNEMLRQIGTKFMVSIKNLTKEEAQELAANPEFTVTGMERTVAFAMNPEFDNMNIVAAWEDETSAKYNFMELEEGHYPVKMDEIACDSEVLRLLGLPYETGSTFRLQYMAGEETLEKEMTVCGIWEGMKYEQNSVLLVSESFVEETLGYYDGEYAPLREKSYDIRGSFADEKDIEGTLDRIVEELGYDPDAGQGEEGFLVHHVNPVYGMASLDSLQTVLMAAVGLVLILLAGYLIIYNIFKISIEKDIWLYGQLKTIGTSPKQIRYMITRQGMVLSVAGIPAGIILGWILGNALLPLVMENLTVGNASFIVPSVWVWVVSALFTLLTVRISCDRPGRIAGKISPVEALKYQSAQKIRKTHKKGRDSSHRIASMAVGNLGRNKGRTVLVVLSISLSAVLLNSALNYTGCMDEETYVRNRCITDFNVTNAAFLKPSLENYQKVVPEDTAAVLKDLEGVTGFAQVYCRMLPEEELTGEEEDLGIIARINGKETTKDRDVFDRKRMIYGYDETAFSLAELVEGSIDYEKLCTGKYVVMAGFLSDRGEYYYELQEFHAGDVIEIEIGGTVQEYTVMAVVGTTGSMEMSYSAGGYESIVFAEPVFLGMFPDMQNPIHCLFDAQEGKFDEVNEKVGSVVGQNGLSVLTRLTQEQEFKRTQYTYSMIGVIVSLILGGIGILNLVNVILTGVIARQREFASMRSIGMTKRQLQKLVVYEGVIYALFAGIAGIFVSGILSVTLVRILSGSVWYMKYHFTIIPAVVAFVICLLLAAAISAMTDRIWNKGSIVEQLRETE